MKTALYVVSIFLLLVGASGSASANDGHLEAGDPQEEARRDSAVVGLRFGVLSSRSGSGPRLIAPSVGADVSAAFSGRVGRYLGVSALYMFAYSNRGTPEVGVSRYENLGAGFLEVRAVAPSATLRLGLGPSFHAVTAAAYAGAASVSSTQVDAGAAGQIVIDFAVPKSRFGLSFGALVLARTQSLDAGAHFALSFAL